MKMDIIKIKDLSKSFGANENKVFALKSVDLTIKKGDFVAIIGQSGSGKSTLMNILGCLDVPTSGSYQINGVEVSQMNSDQLAELRSTTFGFIFQRYNLLSNLSALDNVALPAVYNGVAVHERRKGANELLIELGLESKTNNRPSELSGGQQQRVSIARALMNGGEIILADEPTGALDSKSGENVMKNIIELHKEGHTIILVTHDKNVANYASRVIEIKDGEVVDDYRQSDDIYDVKENKAKPNHSYFAQLKYMLIESFKMSLHAIFTHKLRSLLTMLGIIIGVAAVVLVVAFGQGASNNIMNQINSLGTNTIVIMPGKNFGDMRSNKVKTLTVADGNYLAKQSYIDSTTPSSSTSGTVTYRNQSATVKLNGVGEQYFTVQDYKLAQGRFLTAGDIVDSNSVIIIDPNTKDKFFPNGQDPIGKVLIFNKKPLKIIGVTEKKESSGPNADMLNIWAPYTTVMHKITGDKYITSVTAKIKDNVNSQLAEQNIIKLLSLRHGKKDFFTINTDSIKQTISQVTGVMTFFVSVIAFISLIVGGIGVMNIMLVSVTERTKEIGLRMAIGAKQGNIMQQFLIEAVLICTMGGMIGLIFSSIAIAISQMVLAGTITPTYPISIMVISILFSMVIGIGFGFMPARNAAKLNPIDALLQD